MARMKLNSAPELEVPQPEPTPRQKLLEDAADCVLHDRNMAYGNPEDNFRHIAYLWNSFLVSAGVLDPMSIKLTAQDVAHLMILMKLARLATNRGHRDSLVDIAGYAACAADCLLSDYKFAEQGQIQRAMPAEESPLFAAAGQAQQAKTPVSRRR